MSVRMPWRVMIDQLPLGSIVSDHLGIFARRADRSNGSRPDWELFGTHERVFTQELTQPFVLHEMGTP